MKRRRECSRDWRISNSYRAPTKSRRCEKRSGSASLPWATSEIVGHPPSGAKLAVNLTCRAEATADDTPLTLSGNDLAFYVAARTRTGVGRVAWHRWALVVDNVSGCQAVVVTMLCDSTSYIRALTVLEPA